jgi:hypothetical protein
MSKKTYLIHGVESVYTRFWYESDKSPEDFDSIEEFMNQADYLDSKGGHSEITHLEDWEECDD